MRPRTELALFAVAMVVLVVLVAALGSRNRSTTYTEERATTYSAEPNGARGLGDGLQRLHVKVERLRRARLPELAIGAVPVGLAILAPSVPLSPSDVDYLVNRLSPSIGLILVGPEAVRVMRCFGFDTLRLADSVAVRATRIAGPAPRVRTALRPVEKLVVVDSSRAGDAEVTRCEVPRLITVESLLETPTGQPVAVALAVGPVRRTVILAADVNLVRNRTLRLTEAGPLVLSWLVGRFQTVWFDEYHHGYASGGSLGSALIHWTKQSPWGWGMVQVVVVGLLALLAAAVRFGPPIALGDRRRRSSVEHVRALASALRAAGGHALAVRLLVDGLRRRLSPGGTSVRGRSGEWLDSVSTTARDPRVRRAALELGRLQRGHPGEAQVLEAANLVEDLWIYLRS